MEIKKSNLLCLIVSFEGYTPTAHFCPGDILTIGFGRTQHVLLGEQADPQRELEWVQNHINVISGKITSLIPSLKEESKISAITSFACDIGINAFKKSTMFKLITDGEYDQISNEFEKWAVIGRKQLVELKHRRKVESCLFHSSWEHPIVAAQTDLGSKLLEKVFRV